MKAYKFLAAVLALLVLSITACEDWFPKPVEPPNKLAEEPANDDNDVCMFADDGVCDVPNLCPVGSDVNDCAAEPGDEPGEPADPPDSEPLDTVPNFGTQTVSDHTFWVGSSIVPLVLPEAVGDAPLRYTLTPDVPGLWFNPITRIVGGTPTEAAEGDHAMVYRVTDADGDTAKLGFLMRIDLPDEYDQIILSYGVVAYQFHYKSSDSIEYRPGQRFSSCRSRYIVSDTLFITFNEDELLTGTPYTDAIESLRQLRDGLRNQCEQQDEKVACRTATIGGDESFSDPHGMFAEASEHHNETHAQNMWCPFGVGIADTAEEARANALDICGRYNAPLSYADEPWLPNSCSIVRAIFVGRPGPDESATVLRGAAP